MAGERFRNLSSVVRYLNTRILSDTMSPFLSLVTIILTLHHSRIDLNPPKAEENGEQEGEHAEHPQETPEEPATPAETPARHSHSRLTNYLNARRMRNATVEERLAALRHVREASQDEQPPTDDASTQRSRNRLSTRLRDKFRVRTSAHGLEPPTASPSENPSPGGSGATTPTVPAHASVAEAPDQPDTAQPHP